MTDIKIDKKATDYLKETIGGEGGSTLYRHTLVIRVTDPHNTYSDGYTFGLSFVSSNDTVITTLDELTAIFGSTIPCSGYAQGDGGVGTLAYGIALSSADQKYRTSILGLVGGEHPDTMLDWVELGTATITDNVAEI